MHCTTADCSTAVHDASLKSQEWRWAHFSILQGILLSTEYKCNGDPAEDQSGEGSIQWVSSLDETAICL